MIEEVQVLVELQLELNTDGKIKLLTAKTYVPITISINNRFVTEVAPVPSNENPSSGSYA